MNEAELDGAAFAGAPVGCLERRRHSDGAEAPGWLPQGKGQRRPLVNTSFSQRAAWNHKASRSVRIGCSQGCCRHQGGARRKRKGFPLIEETFPPQTPRGLP